VTFAELEERFHERAKELEQSEQRLEQSQRERDEYKKLCDHLLEENARLKRGLFGQKAERWGNCIPRLRKY